VTSGQVLVTGGCGFVGSHLVHYLVECGHSVIVIDDLSNGDFSRIQNLARSGQVQMFEGNAFDERVLNEVFERSEIWGVVHLASPISVADSRLNPNLYFDTVVGGTYTVVAVSGYHKVRRFLFANTAGVYGSTSMDSPTETAAVAPRTNYAVCKFLAEQTALLFCTQLEIGCVSVRLANLYGKYASALFGLFVSQRSAGHALTVTGDGTQLRDFTHVVDVVKIMEKLLSSDIQNEIVNVGTGQPTTVLRLAEMFDWPIEFIPRPSDEPFMIGGSVDRLRRLLPEVFPLARPEDVIPSLIAQ